jgi:hypothetical protein
MSKYLPTDLEAFLPPSVPGPDDTFIPPPEFLQNLQYVFDAAVPPPIMSPVRFGTKPTDLAFNSQLLAVSDFDFEAFINQYSESTLGFGSEFRPLDQLERILQGHPNFSKLAEVVMSGMPYRFTSKLSEAERIRKLTAMLALGDGRAHPGRTSPS